MKLLDLDPHWLLREGRRVGMIFKSPVHKEWKQTCFFVPLTCSEQMKAIEDLIGTGQMYKVQLCRSQYAWTCTPPAAEADFETISITPSIDGSAGGMWHGYITNGKIV